MVCHFLGKNEDQCDVGCGYISSDDARVMVSFCNQRFSLCAKYQELTARFPQEAASFLQPQTEPRREPASPKKEITPLVKPFRVKWPLPFHARFIAANNFAHTLPLKEESTMAHQTVKNLGWRVALAGTGINLALGVLYAWSIFKGEISESIARGGAGAFQWDPASVSDPYAVACLAFAFSMIVAGKCQDMFGPRLTAILGGILVGSGFVLASQTTGYWGWILGFGLLAGSGMGFGYSAATPPALKWFPPAKTGLVAGIVVSGFGLAPVYIAPLAQYLLESVGLQSAMLIFGISFVLVVCSLGLLVVNPPQGYVAASGAATSSAAKKAAGPEVNASKLFTDGRFYTLWFVYFIGAGAGLMVIGSVAGMAKESLGALAFLAVAIMAVGNAAGRIVAGLLSDKIGRVNTLLIMLVFQATMMLVAIPVMGGGTSAFVIVLLATFIGFNYGTNLCLFPAFAKDFWGLKNFGMNYGILFSAWGVGGFVLVRIAETLRAHSGSYTSSFAVAAVLLLVAGMLSLSLRPRKVAVPQEALAPVSAADEEELAVQKIK